MQYRGKYSLAWSWGVFKAFSECYARATEIVLEILDLSPSRIVQSLSSGSSFWERFKKLVQIMDTWLKTDNAEAAWLRDPEAMARGLLRYGIRRGLLNKCTLLTQVEDRYKLLEHGLKGGLEGSTEPDRPHT